MSPCLIFKSGVDCTSISSPGRMLGSILLPWTVIRVEPKRLSTSAANSIFDVCCGISSGELLVGLALGQGTADLSASQRHGFEHSLVLKRRLNVSLLLRLSLAFRLYLFIHSHLQISNAALSSFRSS